MKKTYIQKLFSYEKYLFTSAVSMVGKDLIALNAWHYPDAKMANAIGPTLAIVLQAGKDIFVMSLIVGKY